MCVCGWLIMFRCCCVIRSLQIAEIRISFDGGATSLNFAEAALLIQGSTSIYSRKVCVGVINNMFHLHIIHL